MKSMIRVIHHEEPPNFPVTDQHPKAKRYEIDDPEHGKLFIDAIGGKPTKAQIDKVLKIKTV